MHIVLGVDGLYYHLPDGKPLFQGITVYFGAEKTGLIGRNGIGKTTLLNLLLGRDQPSSGGVVRSCKVALLPQRTDEFHPTTVADAFSYLAQWSAYNRILSGAGTSEDLDLMAPHWDLFDRIEQQLDLLQAGHLDLDRPFETLSGGEQMRIRLARILLDEPDFVLLDEPTNHLDRRARTIIYDWVTSWKNGLLVVSHDRPLLDLMERIVLLEQRGPRIYGGNYSFYRAESQREQEALERDLVNAREEYKTVRRQAIEVLERQQRRQSSGHKRALRTGIPLMALGILKRRGEVTAAKLAGKHEEKVVEAEGRYREAREAASTGKSINIDLSSSIVPSQKRMLQFIDVNHQFPEMAGLLWPEALNVTISGPARVAVQGPNGSGKTTFLSIAAGRLVPTTGDVYRGTNRCSFLDQRTEMLIPHLDLLGNMQVANPQRPIGDVRLLLARFLFDEADIKKPVEVLSGGERMRAGLLSLLCRDQVPDLLILDEPTNNLDLESLERLVEVLRIYAGTLIVVSHDTSFLDDIEINQVIELSTPL